MLMQIMSGTAGIGNALLQSAILGSLHLQQFVFL
jgi:hypothetical protein